MFYCMKHKLENVYVNEDNETTVSNIENYDFLIFINEMDNFKLILKIDLFSFFPFPCRSALFWFFYKLR